MSLLQHGTTANRSGSHPELLPTPITPTLRRRCSVLRVDGVADDVSSGRGGARLPQISDEISRYPRSSRGTFSAAASAQGYSSPQLGRRLRQAVLVSLPILGGVSVRLVRLRVPGRFVS